MPDLTTLQRMLSVNFKDKALLERALVHSSYLNENPTGGTSNERLEFLGDAVLGLLVAEKLYQDFPDSSEGEMTRLRSSLVRRDALANIANSIQLGEFLSLGRGEEASGGRKKPANLAGAFEALIAAVYLDRGLVVTRRVVLKLLAEELEKATREGTAFDYKSQLQELTQAKYHSPPSYRIVEAAGPDHDRQFTVEVVAGPDVLGRGSGKSRKLAENEAARAALGRLSEDFTP